MKNAKQFIKDIEESEKAFERGEVVSLDEVIAKEMKDPEFRKEWDKVKLPKVRRKSSLFSVEYCNKNCSELHSKFYHRCCYCHKIATEEYPINYGKCSKCKKEHHDIWYAKNRIRVLLDKKEEYEKNPEPRKRKGAEFRRAERRMALMHYGNGNPSCECCGETVEEFLCLDHIDNDGKKERELFGGGISYYTSLRKRGYPKIVRILCHNCNMARAFYGVCPHNMDERQKQIRIYMAKLAKVWWNNENWRFWQLLRNVSNQPFVLWGNGDTSMDTFWIEDKEFFEKL